MKLVIDRSKWYRGRGGSASKLLRNADGKMCCLGFFGLECGIDPDLMLEEAEPECIASAGWPSWLMDENEKGSDDLDALIRVNDNRDIEDEARERRIAAIFAEHGVEVEFIDGPVSP